MGLKIIVRVGGIIPFSTIGSTRYIGPRPPFHIVNLHLSQCGDTKSESSVSFIIVLYFWCTRVAINNVIVQCNGGFLHDIIVDTIMLLLLGNTNKFHDFFLCLQPMFLPRYFDNTFP